MRRAYRKAVLCLAAALILLALAGDRGRTDSLRERAHRIRMLVGAGVDPAHLAETDYATTLAREFRMVEPETVMKRGALRPNRNTFSFGPGDQGVAFARAHRMKVRGHNLVWRRYNPAWLRNGHCTPEQLSQLLHDHITAVMEHYAGKVFAWDGVIEAFDGRDQPRNAADLTKQADIYREVATACAGQSGCTAFQTRGFRTSIPGSRASPAEQLAPLLFDRGYAAKPAYDVVLDVLQAARQQRARRGDRRRPPAAAEGGPSDDR